MGYVIMSIKIYFLNSHTEFFPENLWAYELMNNELKDFIGI